MQKDYLASIAVLAVVCVAPITFADDGHWVGTWGCGPQLTEPNNLPPAPLANSTLRQFVHVTLGGKHLRVRFSNAFGNTPVVINSVHVALAADSPGSGHINPATDKPLAFHGAPCVMIPPGEVVWSDPFDYSLPGLTNLGISIYFGSIAATTITGHPGSRTTSFIVASNVVSAASLSGAAATAHWYIITGVDVLADSSSRAVVTLGDSITDGRGSVTDGNNRWPDVLGARLAANSATSNIAVINMGIGGGGVYGGLGPAGLNRFDRDVPDQSGARWLIVFIGVNDIGSGRSNMTTATNLISAYITFATRAHARGMRVYGATITPFGGSKYYSNVHEQERQYVNAWFRTNAIYDGLIDFDAAVRDQMTLTNLYAPYDSDHLHLNPAGYQAMANAIDLKLFTK